MESIERLLAELRAEYQESQKKSAQLKNQPTVKAEPLEPEASVRSGKTLSPGNFDSDLAKVKAEYEKKDKAAEIVKQQQIEVDWEQQNKAVEIVKQEQPLAKKVVEKQSHLQTHREKVRQAQVWLKKLDKNSDEGYWFDQFAFKYASRIDAAIDYLQAVNEFD